MVCVWSNRLKATQSQAKNKDYFVSDTHGLRLLVTAKGGKYWRLKYRFNNKQCTLALGVYPEVSLKEARGRTLEVRLKLRDDIDPAAERRAKRAKSKELTLEVLASTWWQHSKKVWSDEHAKRVWTRIKDNALIFIGDRNAEKITPQEIIRTVRKIEERGAHDVASRVLNDLRRIYTLAEREQRISYNPAAPVTSEALQPVRMP